MKNRLLALVSAVISGLFVGLGAFLFSLILCIPYENTFVLKLLASLIFPVGLFLICNLKTNLYTGKIGFIFQNNKNDNLNLPFIYVGNLIGIIIFGLLSRLIIDLCNFDLLINTVNNLATSRVVNLSTSSELLIKTFSNSFFCGIFVFLAVYCWRQKWNYFIRLFFLILNVALFVLFGFEHCIANVFYFSFSLSFNVNILINVLIATIGNSVGSIFTYFVIKLSKR